METDISVSAIANAHPKNMKPVPAERAVCDQIERLMRVKSMTFEQAAAYLMERTKLYAQKTKGWPRDELKFIPEAQNWFMQGCYAADESLWEYQGKDSMAAREPGYFDWKRDMIEHPENYAKGGGK